MEKRLRKCTSPLNHSGVVIEEGISKHCGSPLLSVAAITSVQALPSARAFAPTLTPVLSPAVLGGPGRCETPVSPWSQSLLRSNWQEAEFCLILLPMKGGGRL